MTSNFQLLEEANKKHLPRINILCKDELAKVRLRPNINFIINMSDSDVGNGSHWVALYISPDLRAYYMDSFGAICPKEIIAYLKPLKRKIAYSKTHIQNLTRDRCGIFSLAFLLYMNKRKKAQESYTATFERFLKYFNLDKQEHNDNKLKKLYASL